MSFLTVEFACPCGASIRAVVDHQVDSIVVCDRCIHEVTVGRLDDGTVGIVNPDRDATSNFRVRRAARRFITETLAARRLCRQDQQRGVKA